MIYSLNFPFYLAQCKCYISFSIIFVLKKISGLSFKLHIERCAQKVKFMLNHIHGLKKKLKSEMLDQGGQ